MLIHVGDDRNVRIDLRLATLLAGIAGAINAAAFRSLGYFSANMTGNVSALSDHAAAGEWFTAACFLGLIVSFIAGSFTSALLIEAGRKRRIAGIYAYSIITEATLLLVLSVVDLVLHPHFGPAIMLAGLSFLMGLQNAATTRISNARVRTSHVSGIATDIGVELAVLLGGAKDTDDRKVVHDRFRLHVATIGTFVAGGIAGVMAYSVIGSVFFTMLAGLLFVIAVPEARRARAVVTVI